MLWTLAPKRKKKDKSTTHDHTSNWRLFLSLLFLFFLVRWREKGGEKKEKQVRTGNSQNPAINRKSFTVVRAMLKMLYYSEKSREIFTALKVSTTFHIACGKLTVPLLS